MDTDSEKVEIDIADGGVVATFGDKTVFLLPPTDTAVVRNIQLVKDYLVVVRWERLATVLYTFSTVDWSKAPSITRFMPARPLVVRISTDGLSMTIEDPVTEPNIFDIDFENMPDEITIPSPLHIVEIPTPSGGLYIQIATPRDLIPSSTERFGQILVTAYAGFGICLPMGFNQHVRSWLDASGSWAQVFARGGGELGHRWHLSGTGPGSLAGAEDILSAVEILRSKTICNKVLCYGFSHGGTQLLRAFLLRPEYFTRLVFWSPVVETCEPRNTWPEPWYLEYGNPKDPAQREAMRLACPTHMLRHMHDEMSHSLAKHSVLFLSSADDDRVSPNQIANFSLELSHFADVKFQQAKLAGHAGLNGNEEATAQHCLLWKFLCG